MSAAPLNDQARQRVLLRGCGTLFFGIFGAFGVLFVVAAGRTVIGGARPYFWRETPCVIIESHRAEEGIERARGNDPRLLIRYRYEVAGAEHTGERVSVGAGVTRDTRAVERLLIEYPSDRRTRCWVNPANAAEAALERDSLWPAFILFVPLIFTAIGVLGIVGVWRAPNPGKPAEWTVSPRGRKVGTAIFFGAFFVIGGVVFYFLGARPAGKIFAARQWPEVPCEIVRSRVANGDDDTYRVDILYRYHVGERELRADRYDFVGGSSSGRGGKAVIVQRYPAGRAAVCFVNPADPTEAVIDRGWQPIMWFGLLPLVFMLFGAAGLGGAFAQRSKRLTEN